MNGKLKELALLFLKLGSISFGGPAAHIAMMREEIVVRREWLTDEEFLDLLGATQLIPGPNSTEMAIHVGWRRAGLAGLLCAGLCFIFPAVVIVTGFAYLYASYGTLPVTTGLLYCVRPVVIAIIAHALWEMAGKALKSRYLTLIAVSVLTLYLLGIDELFLLLAGGLATARLRLLLPVAATAAATPFSLNRLFLLFLKIGSILYGSGYVLIAFLRADFVTTGWLSDAQLLAAVTVGQVTPGPLFTTATFIGYVLAGFKGAALATLGIFLPSFIFVAISGPLVPRMRASATTARFLDGVNASSLALMAGVCITLSRSSLIDLQSLFIAAFSLTLLLKYRVNSAWLVALAALLGVLQYV